MVYIPEPSPGQDSPVTGPSYSPNDDYTAPVNPYEQRKIGVNLLGQEEPRQVEEGPLSVIGGAVNAGRAAVGGGLDLLFSAWDTPNRIIQSEVAKARVNKAVRFGDPSVSRKYISMVEDQDMSISEVADIMYKDGVAVTGGRGHDLLVSIFLDPMNWVAPSAMKGISAIRKSAGILDELSEEGKRDIFGRIKQQRQLTPDQERFMNNRLATTLGTGWRNMGRGLSGARKAFAHAFFGRASSAWLASVGINALLKISGLADAKNAGAAFDVAFNRGAAHTIRGAAATYLVNQSVVRNSAAVNARVRAVNDAVSAGDLAARERFLGASRLDETAAGLSDEQILEQFDELVKMRDSMPVGADWQRRAAERLSGQAVETELGVLYGGDSRRLITYLDDAYVNNGKAIDREVAGIMNREADKSRLIIDQGMDATKQEVHRLLSFIIDQDEAYKLVDDILLESGGDIVRRNRQLIELLNSSRLVHLGHSASVLGDDLLALRELGRSRKFIAELPEDIRTIVREQVGRLTIVGNRTMTTADRDALLGALNAAEDIEKRREIVRDAIMSFDNLGAEFQNLGKAADTLVTDGTIVEMTELLKAMDNIPESVPVVWTRALANVPQYINVFSNAARLGYKVILEPVGVVARKSYKQIDTGARPAVRAESTALWVPLVDEGMDVVLSNRTAIGRIVEKAFTERTTIKIMQNSLDRMYEYVQKSNVAIDGKPFGTISRNLVKALHAEIMDYAFATKNSLRTVGLSLEGRGDSVVNGLIDRMQDRARRLGPEATREFNVLVHNGILQDMLFYAARGDTELVGTAQAFTGAVKHWMYRGGGAMSQAGRAVTNWTDHYYGRLKFGDNPTFWVQEIIESKFFNRLRGIMPEWKIDVGDKELVRFGSKKTYDVIDPDTGKTIRLDSTKIIQEYANASRPELKYTQEMAMLTHYLGYKTTEAMLSSSTMADALVTGFKDRGLFGRISGPAQEIVGRKKADEFWLLTTEQTLNRMAESLPTLMAQNAPRQWDIWLEAAGGDARGAALLMLHKASALRGSRAVVADYLRVHTPAGYGFGRMYDDDPIKILRSATKEARRAMRGGDPTQIATKLADSLVRVRALAKNIGYADDTIMNIDLAIKNLRAISPDRNMSLAKMAEIDKSLGEAGEALTKEFTAAITRKTAVRDLLIGSGVPKPMAAEMAASFVVAEKRAEMLPEISLAIENLVTAGKAVDPADIDKLKDHLQALREWRAGEQTVINALMDGIERTIKSESMRVHFYNTERSFVERSLNHVVFSLYPTSYMFGKVLPEYMRLLFATRTNSLAGKIIYAPQNMMRIALKYASGGKFNPKAWSEFAPLTGFAAMYRVRQDIIRELGSQEDLAEYNPLMFLILQMMIPGIPTDITVSANPMITEPIKETVSEFQETEDFGSAASKGLQTLSYQFGRAPARTVGAAFLPVQIGKIAGQIGKASEEAGGPVELIQSFTEGAVDQISRIIFNKR